MTLSLWKDMCMFCAKPHILWKQVEYPWTLVYGTNPAQILQDDWMWMTCSTGPKTTVGPSSLFLRRVYSYFNI